ASALLLGVLLAILVTIFDGTPGKVLFWAVVILGVPAWCWYALPRLMRWYAKSYAITTRRILFRDGMFRAADSQVELVGVNNRKVQRSLWDTLFRSGTIDLGGGHLLENVPGVSRVDQLIGQLVAHQTEPSLVITQRLRELGYRKL